MSIQQPIGVFDSGIGGLTALHKLVELLPKENFIYLGDTARVPYGNLSPSTIEQYGLECAQFLLSQSVKLILVACNTVSSVALNTIAQVSPVPVIGVIKPAVAVAMRYATPQRKIAIIGTRATIHSRAYEMEIEAHAAKTAQNVWVQAIACPLFVPLVEEGWHEHPATYAVVSEYLAPVKEKKPDSLILGCTHYPFLKKVIHDILPEVDIIDSGEEAAQTVADFVLPTATEQGKNPNRTITCYFTDLPHASLAFMQTQLGLDHITVKQVSL
ncbi:MAG: glutamate racemase [Gammaproteobacteria bacterium]